MITVILFVLTGYFPYELELVSRTMLLLTVVIAFIQLRTKKEISNVEFICDTLVFLTFNIIGFGLDAYYLSDINDFPFFIITNLVLALFYVVGYGIYVHNFIKNKVNRKKEMA